MEWFSQNAHRKCNQETPSILWGHLTINLDTYCHVLVPHIYQYLNERGASERKRPNCFKCKESAANKRWWMLNQSK